MIEARGLSTRQKDYTGQQYNSWTVVSYVGIKRSGPMGRTHTHFWSCRCDCGATAVLAVNSVVRGQSKSCMRCGIGEPMGWNHPLYPTWCGMKTRCSNPNIDDWKYYGGRGIQVCPKWRKSFSAWLADVGERPSPEHSLDRINPNGDYEPGNVRWATKAEQARNRRNVLSDAEAFVMEGAP